MARATTASTRRSHLSMVTPASSAPSPDLLTSAARHQAACGLQALVTLMKTTEAMHRFLLDSTHSARARHEAVVSQLQGSKEPEQLNQLQVELWQVDSEIAQRYWAEVSEAFTHMQAELADQGSKAVTMWLDDAGRSVAQITERMAAEPTAPWDSWMRAVGNSAAKAE